MKEERQNHERLRPQGPIEYQNGWLIMSGKMPTTIRKRGQPTEEEEEETVPLSWEAITPFMRLCIGYCQETYSNPTGQVEIDERAEAEYEQFKLATGYDDTKERDPVWIRVGSEYWYCNLPYAGAYGQLLLRVASMSNKTSFGPAHVHCNNIIKAKRKTFLRKIVALAKAELENIDEELESKQWDNEPKLAQYDSYMGQS